MKDEIKEILDKFNKVLENYELDKKFGQMSVDSICHLFPSEMVAIKDYITNLQEKLKVSQTNEETYRLEMQDITKILGLDEHTTFDEVKEYATNLQERNEKAIECIKDFVCTEEYIKVDGIAISDNYLKLLNILQGEDKDVKD